MRQPCSLILLGARACPAHPPRQLRVESRHMPGQGLCSWQLRGRRSSPPAGSCPLRGQQSGRCPPTCHTHLALGPLFLSPSLSPANQGCMQDPASLTGPRDQTSVPPGPERPPRSWWPSTLPSCWGAGGSRGALGPPRPAHLAKGQRRSDFGDPEPGEGALATGLSADPR